jgi:hypothetical protein
MDNLDKIYNEALEMLKQGRSKQEVLLKHAQFSKQLSPLLDISSLFISLPKNTPPTPAMQRKYIFISSKRAWLAWLHVSKFAAASMSLILLVSAFSVTGYAALRSGPGQTLFAVKKSAEKARLLLAYNQTDKANIQVAIAKQRLADAQEIFNNPQSNIEQKKAAITELTTQASTAISEVTTVTEKDPNSEKSHPLLNSLEEISNQQRTLLTQITPDKQITDVTSSALLSLNSDSKKITAIKEHVAIANNEQTLAKLTSDANSVAVLGQISKISDTQITVEKTTFNINSKTLIKDINGKTVEVSTLTPKTKVNVVGLQGFDSLIAQQILVTTGTETATTSTSTEGEVKGENTQVASDRNATSVSISLKKAEKPSSTGESLKADPSTATGSFILEDPTPLFTGN